MKKLVGLIVAGVAIKYFLDSQQGRQLAKQVKDWLGEAQDKMSDIVQRTTDTVRQAASNVDVANPGTNG